ncbi:MAG: HAD family hydrolase [Halieaceae bacterium]|jgi:HAD superfamily hydrolase (TIGR01509 family)|nr:HAD family hydrolase [Halieaceae bacterium]
MNRPRLRGIIFDLDGTLVDSRLDFAAMRRELEAPPAMGLLEHVESLASEEERQAAMEVIHRHEMAGAAAATWMPGARAVLDELHQRRVPLAIVTRNSRRAACLTMQRLAMPAVLLKAREDAAPKPDPEALLMVAAQWQLAPRHCAYVGDFRYDLEAAERAGMLPVLYVGQGPVPREHRDHPWILQDFAALPAWVVTPG